MHSREMNITRVHRVMHSLKKHEALQSNRWDFSQEKSREERRDITQQANAPQ